MSIEFIIQGNPKPKGRPRFTKSGIAYTDKNTKAAESHVMTLASASMKNTKPYEGPVMIGLDFYMPIPVSYSKEYQAKAKSGQEFPIKHKSHINPDIDNMIKLIMDALNGVCWEDDSQICSITANKLYCQGENPRTEVFISQIRPTPTTPPHEAEGESGGGLEEKGELIG
jgi:Holliday junction resolvase RusA-like endonuclease